MLDWLSEDRLGELLDLLCATVSQNSLWVAPCRRVGEHVLAHSPTFATATELDPTSWTA